jgi:hypothetical protein
MQYYNRIENDLLTKETYRAPRLARPLNASDTAEDSFVYNYLNAYLDNIFSTERLFYQAWANLTLNSSKDNLKPDWTLYIKPWFKKFEITSCEVKPPGKVGRGDVSDFVKIGLELKGMLDSIVEIGVENASVFGILVEGQSISFYCMNVVGPAYCLYQLGSPQLITKSSQLPLFPSLFETFLKFKVSHFLLLNCRQSFFLCCFFIHRIWLSKQQ